jgi:spermidine/putrescine transport system ATP-binding protein
MRYISVRNVSKAFDGEHIINSLNLEIPAGKFFALLGPSGCGKTTILRLIAGLEQADTGHIFLGEQDITNVPIYQRKINTVFQHYALFTHLTIFENVAYGLRIKGLPEKKVRERVLDALRMIRMVGHENKYPRNLSGGQQQRVALARAIVNEPDVLLLDEPLAALDLKLKEQMLIELINLQDKLKTTFIYVTHDQTEALTVADKMAIMSPGGNIEQIGTPKEIYEFPQSRFVATFVGTTNLFEGTYRVEAERQRIEIEQLDTFDIYSPVQKTWLIPGCRLLMSIRPEKIYISKKPVEGFTNMMQGRVADIVYYGSATGYRIEINNGQMIKVFEQNEEHFPQETIDYDDQVYLYFQKENVVLLER